MGVQKKSSIMTVALIGGISVVVILLMGRLWYPALWKLT